jgi:arylsulfatase A-like enzyme
MSLLTGMFPQQHKVQDQAVLPDEIPTIASLLRELGYRTQAFVDDGFMNSRWGFDRGFDDYDDRQRSGLARTIPRAIRWLRSNAHERFFLFLHTYDAHSTGAMPYYHAPAPFEGAFSAPIDSHLRSGDMKEFKQKWEAKKDRLSDDDLRFIQASYAEGIRYIDDQLESFLIRVPLLIRAPGYGERGQRIESVVSSIDIAPTILEFVGYPETVPMDGKSMLGLPARDDEDGVAYSIRTRLGAKRFSIRSRRYHFLWDGDTEESQFFDLHTDPREETNLSPSVLTAEATLRGRLLSWMERYYEERAEGTAEENVLDDPVIRRRLRALGYLE